MDDKVWGVLGHVLLAAFLGVVGQLIRVVVGLKKQSDQGDLKDRFNAQKLLTSLGIAIAVGAIAGVLAGIQSATSTPDTKALLGFMGAGYSGTDFIEGLMRKALPTS
jgi:hypothetical protein